MIVDSIEVSDDTIGTQREHQPKVFTLLGEAQDYISVVAELLAHKSKSSIADDPVVTVLKAAMAKIDEISIELDETFDNGFKHEGAAS